MKSLFAHMPQPCVRDVRVRSGLCLPAASDRVAGVLGFHHRSTAQRRSPLIIRGRLLELRCRARPHPPSITTQAAQHHSPHAVGYPIVRHRPHNPRRQSLELLVVPPLRLGHLSALLQHHAPWPRGSAARPPRSAPRWRAFHRGDSTPWARRASRRWPHGKPWLLCASRASRRTARPPPAAHRTCHPTARRAWPASQRPREPPAAPPRHPQALSSSAASSPPCETPRVSSKRQGSLGSSCRRGTSSAASDRGTYHKWGASPDRRPYLTAS
eukprot:scaffold6412_cov55-Phaeocystis_antarctica.AAC.2